MAEVSFPRTRRDFVYILKKNEFNIPEAVNEVITLLNIEEELTDSVTSYMRIVQSNFKRAKNSLEKLNTDLWNSLESETRQIFISIRIFENVCTVSDKKVSVECFFAATKIQTILHFGAVKGGCCS